MTRRGSLEDTARAMLNEAVGLYADLPRAANWLRDHLRRIEEPLRTAVAGLPQSGKSTLIEALGGERPTRSLRDLTLTEASVTDPPDASPAMGRIASEADAVLYLMRTRHGRDTELLRSAFEHPIASRTPVNTIVVLSRADEIGAGRIDALTSAKQIARRSCRDVELRALCLTVVAVAGLIGHAGRTLTEGEFATLSALAGVQRTELNSFLLSADRFAGNEFPIPLPPAARRELLERFGIFGVRLTTTLIRSGSDTSTKLSAELVSRSGLRELRESIRQYFAERRGVLKARAALLALDTVLRSEPRPGVRTLVDDLERVLTSAHDFHELRLLAALQAGRGKLPDGLDEQAQRLVGGYGTSTLERLAIDYEPTETELRRTILDTLDHWQEHAENPLLSAEGRHAARVVVRSCEGMLADLYSR